MSSRHNFSEAPRSIVKRVRSTFIVTGPASASRLNSWHFTTIPTLTTGARRKTPQSRFTAATYRKKKGRLVRRLFFCMLNSENPARSGVLCHMMFLAQCSDSALFLVGAALFAGCTELLQVTLGEQEELSCLLFEIFGRIERRIVQNLFEESV